jgi:glycosyltransferase involved in cell wall biosynthesis
MMLPIGVDEKRFTPGKGRNDLLAGGRKLLHVGSLVPVKDQPTLLRAFARVREAFPDACLHLVGDGPREAALRELVSALSVEDHVVFHGSVPHHELPAYYRSADLAVMSSLHEGQEWVTQEAAACGRTTVGTKVGVMADLEPATTTVAPRDHIALSRAVVDALSDPRRLHQRHLDARRLVVERYSLSRTTAALTSLYDELRDSAS